MELQMKKIIIFFAMSSCFIMGTSSAHADADLSQGRMQDKMLFRAMDTNFDERVTKDEFIDYALRKFKEMDLDSSGALNSNEMQEGYNRMIDKIRSGDRSLSGQH